MNGMKKRKEVMLFDTHLSERWPVSFSTLMQVVIGVSVCVEDSSCAQFVHGVQTDS